MFRWKLIVVVLAMAATVWSIAGKQWEENLLVSHTIDQTEDTAVVVKFDRFTGRDGYTYLDSIRCSTTKRAVSWTAPKTVRRVLVQATPSARTTDTLIVDHGSANDTITIDCNPALTRAAYVDSIVARINVASMSDTVTAEDSGTYVKIVCDLAQDAMNSDTRFALAYGTGTNNMSAGTTDSCSVKMVCDSMVATINALVTVRDSVTAAVSGDSVYTITADRPGWPMVFKVGPADTTQDTVHVTNAGTATFTCDTATIPLPFQMWSYGYKCLYGDVVLRASPTTTKGYGTHDSAVIRLYKTNRLTGSDVLVAADSGIIPKTFHIAKVACDTCYGNGPMFFRVIMFDTATDTSGTRYHEFNWTLTGTE